MAFLRRETSDKGISIGICYSIFQKCIRRCKTPEALYYGQLIFNDGTPNSLRKRLVMSCLEDMANLELALEIMDSKDEKLFDYIRIISQNKKTHISSWYQRVCLDYAIYNTETEIDEINLGINMQKLERDKNYKEIRKLLGKECNKLYSFTGKERLVWAVKILTEYRPELIYKINRNIDKTIQPKKFTKIPDWVMDKHVPGGTPGYQFFFDHSCIMNNRIYQDKEPYEIECKNIYLNEEIDNTNNSRTKHTIDRWRDNEYNKDYIPSILLKCGYRNIIQIQLLTRRNHPKVYFVTNFKNGKKYVMKGPLSQHEKQQIELTEKIKEIIKFPRLNSEITELKNEIWLKSDSLVDYNNEVIYKDSKLESNRPIYNGANVNCKFDYFFGPNRNVTYCQKDIILATLFKSMVGAKDFASRNYLIKDKVYSIDDHSYLPEDVDLTIIPDTSIKKIVKRDWKLYLKLEINKKPVIKKLKKWKKRLKSYNKNNGLEYYDNIKSRLKKIINLL